MPKRYPIHSFDECGDPTDRPGATLVTTYERESEPTSGAWVAINFEGCQVNIPAATLFAAADQVRDDLTGGPECEVCGQDHSAEVYCVPGAA